MMFDDDDDVMNDIALHLKKGRLLQHHRHSTSPITSLKNPFPQSETHQKNMRMYGKF